MEKTIKIRKIIPSRNKLFPIHVRNVSENQNSTFLKNSKDTENTSYLSILNNISNISKNSPIKIKINENTLSENVNLIPEKVKKKLSTSLSKMSKKSKSKSNCLAEEIRNSRLNHNSDIFNPLLNNTNPYIYNSVIRYPRIPAIQIKTKKNNNNNTTISNLSTSLPKQNCKKLFWEENVFPVSSDISRIKKHRTSNYYNDMLDFIETKEKMNKLKNRYNSEEIKERLIDYYVLDKNNMDSVNKFRENLDCFLKKDLSLKKYLSRDDWGNMTIYPLEKKYNGKKKLKYDFLENVDKYKIKTKVINLGEYAKFLETLDIPKGTELYKMLQIYKLHMNRTTKVCLKYRTKKKGNNYRKINFDHELVEISKRKSMLNFLNNSKEDNNLGKTFIN